MGGKAKGHGGASPRKIHDTKGRNNQARAKTYGQANITGFKTVRSGPIWNPTVKVVKSGSNGSKSYGPYTGKKKKGW